MAALDAEWYLRDNPLVPDAARARGHGQPRRGAVGADYEPRLIASV